MVRVGARLAIFSLLLAAGGAACNAITGAKERTLDPDLGTAPDRDTGPDDEDEDSGGPIILDGGPMPETSTTDTGVDAGPIVITVNVKGTWTSLNGGFPTIVSNGVKIGSMDAGAANNHPVIIPAASAFSAPLEAENYTVRATIRAPAAGGSTPEFGIVTRVQGDKSCIVMANVYGAQPPAFIGNLPSGGGSPWNPSKNATGPSYVYTPSAQYKYVLRMIGNEARAKFWAATEPEPAADQMVYLSPYPTGKGVGFYTYLLHDAVLEEMTITVP